MRRFVLLAAAILSSTALAQPAAPPPPEPARAPGEVALAPSRFELLMTPGGSQTVVVNVISSGSAAEPLRLLASLGDWTMTPAGEMQFSEPGSNPRSATPWLIYSPVEFAVEGGQSYPIRVTLDVPKDASPGDHTAVLFVEQRPRDIKTQHGEKQITFHFRLAAVFYVMIQPLTHQGSLTALEATATPAGITLTPTLHNEGNSHLRPVQSFEILDGAEQVVASQAKSETYPVLGGTDYRPALKLDRALPPGEYSLRYHVDFRDGSNKVVEGRKALTVPEAAPAKKAASKKH